MKAAREVLSKWEKPALVMLGLALHTRDYRRFGSVSLDELTRFRIDPFVIGVSVQILIVPIALVYLFSRTPVFRRLVSDESARRDGLKLFGALASLQFLALFYELNLSPVFPEHFTFGLPILITAGLLGGWRVGLGVGLITFLVTGSHIPVPIQDLYQPIWAAYREGNSQELSDLIFRGVIVESYLSNPWARAPIWAGVVAGLASALLKKQRFSLLSAFILGAVLYPGSLGFIIAAEEETAHWVSILIPSALTLGISMAAVALMIHDLQAEAVRRRAEAAQLALTQAELRALRAQINPHFLFNALNTIRYFVRTDSETARRLLLDLSEIFQRALRSGELYFEAADPGRHKISFC